MLDNNYSSKEWEKLWEDLDSLKEQPSFIDPNKIAKTKHVKPKDFGIGAAMMAEYQDPVQGLTAEIRRGAGHIEFSPSINQSGYHSFTKIGAVQRRAMRELKDVNNVTINTHAHAGVSGLTGFEEKSYSFNDSARQTAIDEVKKAIDFAADVAEGGSITFHAGEFARPLFGQKWGEKGEEFQMSKDEQDNMIIAIIDKETKQPKQESIIRMNQQITTPVFKYDKESMISVEGIGEEDEKYKIYDFEPKDKNGKGDEVKTMEFKNFRQYAAWLAKEDNEFKTKYLKNKNVENLIKNVNGEDEINDYYILEQAAKKKFIDEQRVGISRAAFQNINQIEKQSNEVEKVLNAVKKAKEITKSNSSENRYVLKSTRMGGAEKVLDESSLEKLKQRYGLDDSDYVTVKNGEVVDGDKQTFDCFYAGDIKYKDLGNRKKEFQIYRENITSQLKNQFDKLKEDYTTVSEFAQEQNRKSFEQLGMELYEKNKALKAKNPKAQDMYFAIENLFPEKHGAHPTELLKTIKEARSAMKEKLKETYNLDEKQAKKISDNSIKATFDTGHLHMWKKYFKRKDGESEDKFNKRFNDWAISQTKKLIDENVIGNIHLADNFGYDDDHVTLGQGTVPIKEYMEMFDKAKMQGKITGKFSVEGFDDSKQRHGVHEAWKQSGVDVFRSQMATDRWVNVGESGGGTAGRFYNRAESYLGNSHKPYFIFGKYSPDPEDWGPWDGLGLE